MDIFDLRQDPPTTNELNSVLTELKSKRTEYIKKSCISDVLHAFVFIALYFSRMLSGYAIMSAVALSTVVAIVLATTVQNRLTRSDRLAIGALGTGTAIATVVILHVTLKQPLPGSLIAGLTAGSIVLSGAIVGRKIKQILTGIEDLKPIVDDDMSRRELATLCRTFPFLAEYREKATLNLRPNLTYGELDAMRRWVKEQPRPFV